MSHKIHENKLHLCSPDFQLRIINRNLWLTNFLIKNELCNSHDPFSEKGKCSPPKTNLSEKHKKIEATFDTDFLVLSPSHE